MISAPAEAYQRTTPYKHLSHYLPNYRSRPTGEQLKVKKRANSTSRHIPSVFCPLKVHLFRQLVDSMWYRGGFYMATGIGCMPLVQALPSDLSGQLACLFLGSTDDILKIIREAFPRQKLRV